MAKQVSDGAKATAKPKKTVASTGGGRSKAAKPKSASTPVAQAVSPAAARRVEAGYHQIAAKAYEIYRERVRTGAPGDAHCDWVAAEAALRGQ